MRQQLVTLADGSKALADVQLREGDMVRVIDGTSSYGRIGKVQHILGAGNVHVIFPQPSTTYHPKQLELVSRAHE